MQQVLSGTTDQVVNFRAPSGLAGVLTVYRKRGTGSWTAMTTPTISEDDPTNAPEEYSLLMDEDMTISAGKTTELMQFEIKAPDSYGMVPVKAEVEIYANLEVNVKEMNDATVLGDGTSGDKWRG